MKKEKIYECEVKRQHQVSGQRFWKWVRREVVDIDRGDTIRCLECKGRVRMHRQSKHNGPRDHVEHVRREDSEKCSLGFYFLGQKSMSQAPVE